MLESLHCWFYKKPLLFLKLNKCVNQTTTVIIKQMLNKLCPIVFQLFAGIVSH